jgi:hypothetical protein
MPSAEALQRVATCVETEAVKVCALARRARADWLTSVLGRAQAVVERVLPQTTVVAAFDHSMSGRCRGKTVINVAGLKPSEVGNQTLK